MIRASHIVSAIIVLLMVLPGMVWGFDYEGSRETLRGIKGVQVLVESKKSEIKKAGLTKSQIQTDVELKLRLAGLNVLDRGPWLYVNVGIVVTGGLYVYTIYLELVQGVSLVRNNKRTFASTWSTASYGTTQKLANIRSKIKDLVDSFINAWLSVNPK